MADQYPNGRRFQWVWVWSRPFRFYARSYAGSWRLIYRWAVHLGPLEVRRWTPTSEALQIVAARRAVGKGET